MTLNKNNVITKRIKTGLLACTGILGLMLTGCGGGGASLGLEQAPKIIVGAGQGLGLSVNKIDGSLKYSLNTLSGETVKPENIEVYAMDGTPLDGVTVTCEGNKLPCEVELDNTAVNKAQGQNNLVIRIKAGQFDYKALLPDTAKLGKAGHERSAEVQVGYDSAMVVAMVEDELSATTGEQIVLGEQLTDEQSAKVNDLVSVEQADTSALNVSETAKALQSSFSDANSALTKVLSSMIENVDPKNAGNTTISHVIRSYVLEGRNLAGTTKPTATNIQALRQVKSVVAQISTIAAREKDQGTKEQLKGIFASAAKATPDNAGEKAIAGKLVFNALSMKDGLGDDYEKELKNAIENAKAAPKATISAMGTKVLPKITESMDKVKSGSKEETLAGFIGSLLVAAEHADNKDEISAQATTSLNTLIEEAPGKVEAVLAVAIQATAASTNENAFTKVVNQAKDVLNDKGSDKKVIDLLVAPTTNSNVNLADVLNIATKYVQNNSDSDALGSVFTDAGAFLNKVAEKSDNANVNEAILVAQVQNTVTRDDKQEIEALKAQVRSGDSVIIKNKSVEGNPSSKYSYEWTINSKKVEIGASAYGEVIEVNSKQLHYIATNVESETTHTITLTQKVDTNSPPEKGSATVSTKIIPKAEALKPIIAASKASHELRKNGSVSFNLFVKETEKEARSLAISLEGNAPDGFTVEWDGKANAPSIDQQKALAGYNIPISIKVSTAAAEQEHYLTFKLAYVDGKDTSSIKAKVAVKVLKIADNQFSFVSLPSSHLVSTALTVRTNLYSEQKIGSVTMALTVIHGVNNVYKKSEVFEITDISTTKTFALTAGDFDKTGNYEFTLSLQSADSTRYLTKFVSVYEENAPIIKNLQIAQKEKTLIDLLNNGTFNVSVSDLTALAVSLAFIMDDKTVKDSAEYSVNCINASNTETFSTTSSGKTADITNFAEGMYRCEAKVTQDSKDNAFKFNVSVIKTSAATLNNVSMTAITMPEGKVVNNQLVYDLTGVTGFSLNSSLDFTMALTSNCGNNETCDPKVGFEVKLADQTDQSLRKASMKITNIVLKKDSSGNFKLATSTASTADIGGQESDGVQINKPFSIDKVDNFDSIFIGAGNNIKVNITELKKALQKLLAEAGHTLIADLIDNMTGSNLELTVNIDFSKMTLKYAEKQIIGFVFKDITVE